MRHFRMKTMSAICMMAAAVTMSSCSSDTDDDWGYGGTTGGSTISGGTTGGDSSGTTGDDVSSSGSLGDVTKFSIAFNKSALTEGVNVDSADDDYIENSSFSKTVNIVFSTSGAATVSGDTDGLEVTINGNDVTVNNTSTDNYEYVLSGKTTDGYFKLYSAKKQAIRLNGADITNPDGAAINNQSKKRTFVVLADGTDNYLTDGSAYNDATDDEDMKATLFSEGQLIFSGTGYLEVDANCKAGIRSDDYVRIMPGANIYVDASSGNGIRGNDAVVVTGGVINVNITGTADKGISTDGYIQIDGGRTTVITSGGYEIDDEEADYTACAGLKADSIITVNGGELYLKSTGTGGKGMNADQKITFNGGSTYVHTTGSGAEKGSYSTSPKGIKADGAMTFNGGRVVVRCEHSEGIESKDAITINGGTIESYSYDDAINSKYDLTINGGYVYAHATNNDAIDANKNLYINGGITIAEGAGAPECGIDAAEGYSIYVNGGTLIATGGSVAATASTSKQASIAVSGAGNGTKIGLLSGTNAVLGYQMPSSGGTALMITSPVMQNGSTYDLRTGCTYSGGSCLYSLTTGCSISGGTSYSVTASTQVGQSMGGMGGMGGGMGPRW